MQTEFLTILLKISLVIFMAGNLLDMGLRLNLKETAAGIKNFHFVFHSLLWGFVILPAVAWGITKIFPLEQPYAIGMILIGVTPCAPFLPMMVDKAKGRLELTAVFMLVVSTFTVFYMPVAVPYLVEGLTVSSWAIAKPLIVLVLLPLILGMSTRHLAPHLALRIQPSVKKTTMAATMIMIIPALLLYGEGLWSSAGSYFLAAQLVFFFIAAIAPYFLSLSLIREEKIVLTLGLITRNLGAALAPLFAISLIDERAIVMVILAIPLQVIFALLASRWFALHQPRTEREEERAKAGDGHRLVKIKT